MFETHVRYLCNGDETVAGHLIDWVAHLVQRPGERVSHAVVITSPTQGVGKDTLAEMIGRVVGDTNRVNVSSEVLSAGYGGLFSGKLFAVVSEIMRRGTTRWRTSSNRRSPSLASPSTSNTGRRSW